MTPELVPDLMANAMVCEDNLILDDTETAVEELETLGDLRVLVVDVTPENVGRDPDGLVQISNQVGVDIVMGCGPYVAASHGDEIKARSAEDWHRELVDQLTAAAPRPALIGEIGTSDPIAAGEMEALIGAAAAQRDTGVPLYVHLHPFARRGHEVLTVIEEHGGEISRTVLCHLDAQIAGGLDYHRELLDRGCRIAFDVWGYEAVELGGQWPTDSERLAATLELLEGGYGESLLHSQDVCMKMSLRRNGGPGYSHLWSKIRPRLIDAGLPESTVGAMLAGNALALFAARP